MLPYRGKSGSGGRGMKKWHNPKLVSLDMSCTAQGKHVCSRFDEIRVDQNGYYWASFCSGEDTNPELSGEVTTHN